MHRCPECWQACYCGGDIDDIEFEGAKYEAECTHCDRHCDIFDEDDDLCEPMEGDEPL